MYYRKISVVLLVFFLCISSVFCTIYRMNATEYSRMPALYSLDEYEACMEQPQAVYCLVKLDLYAEPGNSLMHTIHEYSKDINRHYNHTNIDRGMCVRTTCRQFLEDRELTDDRQLDEVLQQCMNDTVQRQYGLSARLAFKFNCDRAGERDEITFADWSFLAVTAALVFAVIGATKYDQYLEEYNKKDQGNQYILSFSIQRNLNFLLNTNHEDARKSNLRGFHGVRSVINFLMISVHVAYFCAGGFQSNPHDVEKSYESIIWYFFYNGLVIVQIFFFMSGFLLAYNIKTYFETQNISFKKIGVIMFERFLRLSPGLGMVIWFTSTWLRHLNSGPLWKRYITNSVVADCQKYWWSHLLYVNNYVPDNRNCALQTWHIAADTQLLLLALVMLFATKKGGRRYAMMALLFLGTLAPGLHVWLTDLDAMVLLKPEFYRTVINDTFFHIHVAGHNNLQNYVIGMAAGFFFYDFRRKRYDIFLTQHFSKYKWVYATSHSLTFPAYAFFFYLCHVFYKEKTALLMKVVFAAVQRLIVAAITLWLILGCVFKAPGIFRRLLESRMWVVPSHLSYGVYLVHLNIVHALLGSRQYISESGTFMLIILYLGVVFLSYILALVLYLVVEAPFCRIAKVMTKSPQPKMANAMAKQQRKAKENMTKLVNGESIKDKEM